MGRLSRYNQSFTLAASAAQSGTTVHGPRENNVHRGVLLIAKATATTGDGTEDLDINVQYQDPASGDWQTLIADAGAFSNGGTGTLRYLVYPGVSDTQTNFTLIEEVPLPRDWRVQTVVQGGGATPDYTYSIGGQLLL